MQDTIEALKMLESDVFSGGYMSTLDDSLESMQVADTVNRKSIEAIAKNIYILSTFSSQRPFSSGSSHFITWVLRSSQC